eukprot:g647.t1
MENREPRERGGVTWIVEAPAPFVTDYPIRLENFRVQLAAHCKSRDMRMSNQRMGGAHGGGFARFRLVFFVLILSACSFGYLSPKDGTIKLTIGHPYRRMNVTWNEPFFFEVEAAPASYEASPVSLIFDMVLHPNASNVCASAKGGIHLLLRKRCEDRIQDECVLPTAEQDAKFVKLMDEEIVEKRQKKEHPQNNIDAIREMEAEKIRRKKEQIQELLKGKRMPKWRPIVAGGERFVDAAEKKIFNLPTDNLVSAIPPGSRLVRFFKSRYLPGRDVFEHQKAHECGCDVKNPYGDKGWGDRGATKPTWFGSVMVMSESVTCGLFLRVTATEACSGHGKWIPKVDEKTGNTTFGCECDPGFNRDFALVGSENDDNDEIGRSNRIPDSREYGCSGVDDEVGERVETKDIPIEKRRDPIGCFETDVRNLKRPTAYMDRDQQIGCTGRLLNDLSSTQKDNERRQKKNETSETAKGEYRDEEGAGAASGALIPAIPPAARLRNMMYRSLRHQNADAD